MSNSKILFSKSGSRKSFIEKCVLFPLNRTLHKKSKQHLLEKRKQLVVFSFDHIGHTINLHGLYEKESLGIFFDWLTSLNVNLSDSTAIDVGANIGNHSLYFSDFFGKVASFEPHPRIYKVLSLNAELSRNIFCYNFGLSDCNREALLNSNSSNMGGSSVLEKETQNSEKIILRELDSLEDFGDIKLIKIDVEGHERKTIAGARRTITKKMPIIIFEQCATDFPNGESTVANEIKELGYRKFAVIERHPEVSENYFNKFVVAPTIGLLRGQKTVIRFVEKIRPRYYEFIIAIPGWLESKISY